METVICARCGTDNRSGRRFCRACRADLAPKAPVTRVPDTPRGEPEPPPVGERPRRPQDAPLARPVPVAPRACPTCGAPDSGDGGACATCGTPIEGPTAGPPASPLDPAGQIHVVLACTWGDESVSVSEPVGLGRDPGFSPYADRLRAHPTVSARHALLEPRHGRLAIHALDTPNGTHVNGRRLEVGEWCELIDGDEVHLSAGCSMVVVGATPGGG